MTREGLLKLLGSAVKKPMGKKGSGKWAATPGDEIPLSEPLPTKISPFWQEGSLPENFFGEVEVPPLPGALLKALGNFPFWRGQERFMEALEPVYLRASTFGMDVFLGEKNSSKDPEKSKSGRRQI
jgi:uncharacterized Zn finger protein